MIGIKNKHQLFQKKLSTLKKVGLDSSCFIYQLSDHPNYAVPTHLLFSMVEKGEITAVTSTITLVEVFVQAEKDKDRQRLKEYEDLFRHFPNLEISPPEWGIARAASQLRASYSLRTPDAIQLATAKLRDADVFITNDKKLQKCKIIEVLILEDFL